MSFQGSVIVKKLGTLRLALNYIIQLSFRNTKQKTLKTIIILNTYFLLTIFLICIMSFSSVFPSELKHIYSHRKLGMFINKTQFSIPVYTNPLKCRHPLLHFDIDINHYRSLEFQTAPSTIASKELYSTPTPLPTVANTNATIATS